MLLSGAFFLDRSNREKSVRTLKKALEDLKDKKRGLYIFPEGTRSYANTTTLLPFKKGAFHLAQQAQVPITPIVVSNTSTIINSKTLTFETGEIIIHVLPQMSTEDLKPEDVGAFSEKVRDAMAKEFEIVGYSVLDSISTDDTSAINTDTEVEDEYETVPNETDETDCDVIVAKASAERTSLLSKTDSS